MKKFGGLLVAAFVIMGSVQAADSKAKPRTGAGKNKVPAAVAEPKASPVDSMAKPMESKTGQNAMKSTEQSARYGMAGCGLGTLVIKENEKGPQIGAWFLNNVIIPQTYAISSGTSNCVEGRSDVAAMEQSVYVVANLASLSKEAAQGSGQHLDGLAEVLGCSTDAQKQRLGTVSQENYDAIFAKQDPQIVLDQYLAVVKADPLLAKDCSKAG